MFNGKTSTNSIAEGNCPCPACRHGELYVMPLMDALACTFCRHIFVSDAQRQLLTMVDSSSPMTWRWNGRVWQDANRNGMQLGWGFGLFALILVLLPTGLVSLATYIFPPLPGSRLAWVPVFWIGLTFFSHFAFALSLLIEYYQFPVLAYLQAVGRNLTSRIFS